MSATQKAVQETPKILPVNRSKGNKVIAIDVNPGGRRKTKLKEVKPKKYGPLNEYDKLHPTFLKALSDVGKNIDKVVTLLDEFSEDLFIYGPSFFPEWTQDDREIFASFIKDAKGTVQIISQYSWGNKGFPDITTDHAKELYKRYHKCFGYSNYLRLSSDGGSLHTDLWDTVAELTGVHKAKAEEGYIDADTIGEVFRVKELLKDIYYWFEECEETGEEQARRERTSAKMNGDYLDDGTQNAIKNGAEMTLKYIKYDDRDAQLQAGRLIAVDTEKMEGTCLRSYFTIGRLVSIDFHYKSSGKLMLALAGHETLSLDVETVKAYYAVTTP